MSPEVRLVPYPSPSLGGRRFQSYSSGKAWPYRFGEVADILGEYEYATNNYASISILARAPELRTLPLQPQVNGLNAWIDTTTGQAVAIIRHIVYAGQSELSAARR